MSLLPDFTATQRRELATLGLGPIQVEELRLALVETRRMIRKPAARNDVDSLLGGVLATSDKLARMLQAMGTQIDVSHSQALAMIDSEYWQGERLEDSGPTVAHHLLPRLAALSDAARVAMQGLPETQTRHRTGDWRPIKRIDDALFSGWSKVYGLPAAPPYPDDFVPSASPGCAFRRIVGICYAAVGGNPDPERPLKAYVAQANAQYREHMTVLEAGIEQANRDSRCANS